MPNGALAISLGDGDKTPSQLAFCCRPFSLLALRLLCFSWYWAISWYGRIVLSWYVLPWRYWPYCRYVVRRGFHIDVMPATQLLRNTTRFPLPWDIGTPRHWNPKSKHRDIGTSGHWNSKCTGRRTGTDPRTGKKGTDPRNGFFLWFRYPLGSHWRSLRCAFHCRASHGGYDVLGGARWLQVQFLVSFFPETLKGRRVPIFVGRELFKHCVLGSFVSSTQSVRACRWWSLI